MGRGKSLANNSRLFAAKLPGLDASEAVQLCSAHDTCPLSWTPERAAPGRAMHGISSRPLKFWEVLARIVGWMTWKRCQSKGRELPCARHFGRSDAVPRISAACVRRFAA